MIARDHYQLTLQVRGYDSGSYSSNGSKASILGAAIKL